MADEPRRLKRFISDQEEAVQLARETTDGSDPLRIDAVNVALSLAHSNAVACDRETTMAELLANAKMAQRFLSGQD